MNLDTPAGEAMRSAGAEALRKIDGVFYAEADRDAAAVLAAALSATVECSACDEFVAVCPDCDGTGRRLAIKEACDECE